MTKVIIPVKIPKWLWEEFEGCAKRRRRKAESMVQEAAFDYVQRLTDEDLDAASRRAGRRSGHREEDAVELVRQVRLRKFQRAANGRTKKASAGGT